MKYEIVVWYEGEIYSSAPVDGSPDELLGEIKKGFVTSLTVLAKGGGFYVFPKGVLDQSVVFLRPVDEP